MLRSIATSGLKGRPRQTRILFAALALAFFFVTLSFLLLSTANDNRDIKRKTTFGEWTAVYVSESDETAEALKEDYQRTASTRLIGTDQRLGLLGTADDDFWSMSHIRLVEGRLPQAINEVVLEVGQLSYFPVTPDIGDTFNTNLVLFFGEDDLEAQGSRLAAVGEEVMHRFRTEVAHHWEKMPDALQMAFEEDLRRVPQEAQQLMEYYSSIGEDKSKDEVVAELEADAVTRYEHLSAIFSEDPGTVETRYRKIVEADEKASAENLAEVLSSEEVREGIRQIIGEHATDDEVDDFIIEQANESLRLVQALRAGAVNMTSSDLEGFGETTIQTRMAYLSIPYRESLVNSLPLGVSSALPREFWPDLSDLSRIVTRQEVAMIRNLKVVGIIEDYHTMWDGPANLYPTAFVTQETGRAFLDDALLKSEVDENRHYLPPHHLFLLEELEPLADPPLNYFENRLSQDAAGGISENLISQMLLLVFGLITGVSIFQISLVQLRKRQRKFALMRSVGATLSQIRCIMFWEAFYLLLIALPVGVGAGGLISWLLIAANNALTGDAIVMTFDPVWLLLGVCVTLLASLVGLFLPLRHLEKIPLRGQVEVIDRSETKRARDILGDRPIGMQSLSTINQRHYRFIRKQRWISTLLFSLILFILLGSLWLIYLSFQEYRLQVVDTDMPDFEFTRSYQQSRTMDEQFVEQFASLERVQRADLFTRGDRVYLWYEGIEDNELLHYYLKMLPTAMHYDYFGTTTEYVLSEEQEHLTKEAMVVDIYGIDIESEYGRRFQDVVPDGFDWEAFDRGESVLLLSPGFELFRSAEEVSIELAEMLSRTERMKGLFDATKSAKISYDYRRVPTMRHETSLADLREITVTIPTGAALGSENKPLYTVRIHEMPVGAVLHALPSGGWWPLSQTTNNPVVITSSRYIDRLYPHRFHNYGTFRYFALQMQQYSRRYGNTMAHIYLPNPTREEALEIKRIGLHHDFLVNELHLLKERLYSKGFQTSLIVGLLGAALLIIALQIQTTSTKGLLETERSRIGILQSIGIRAAEYRRAYFIDALKRIVLSALMTHLALVMVIGLYLLLTHPGSDLLLEMQISLSDYPYGIHGLIVLVFIVLGTAAAFMPLGNILQRQPVENIRSLK